MAGTGTGGGGGGGGSRTHGIPLMMRALGLFMIIIQLQMHVVTALWPFNWFLDDIFSLRLGDPRPTDFLLVVKSHLSKEAALSCGGKRAGSDDGYFHHFSLSPNEARKYFFRADLGEYLVITCYYSFSGNYMADIVLFDMRWPDVEYCRWLNGGCTFLIGSDSSLYKITRRRKTLQGDLSLKHCKHSLVFSYGCHEKQHTRPLAGRICTYFEWFTHSYS